MKLINFVLLLVLLGFTNRSYSETCGKVIANSFVTQGDFAISLEKHNGTSLNMPKLSGLPMGPLESSGFAILQLSPGLHEFKGYAICTSGFCEKSRLIGGGDADGVDFAINIEAGKSYKIAAKPAHKKSLIPGKRFDVFIIKMNEIKCEGKALEAISTQAVNSELVLLN